MPQPQAQAQPQALPQAKQLAQIQAQPQPEAVLLENNRLKFATKPTMATASTGHFGPFPYGPDIPFTVTTSSAKPHTEDAHNNNTFHVNSENIFTTNEDSPNFSATAIMQGSAPTPSFSQHGPSSSLKQNSLVSPSLHNFPLVQTLQPQANLHKALLLNNYTVENFVLGTWFVLDDNNCVYSYWLPAQNESIRHALAKKRIRLQRFALDLNATGMCMIVCGWVEDGTMLVRVINWSSFPSIRRDFYIFEPTESLLSPSKLVIYGNMRDTIDCPSCRQINHVCLCPDHVKQPFLPQFSPIATWTNWVARLAGVCGSSGPAALSHSTMNLFDGITGTALHTEHNIPVQRFATNKQEHPDLKKLREAYVRAWEINIRIPPFVDSYWLSNFNVNRFDQHQNPKRSLYGKVNMGTDLNLANDGLGGIGSDPVLRLIENKRKQDINNSSFTPFPKTHFTSRAASRAASRANSVHSGYASSVCETASTASEIVSLFTPRVLQMATSAPVQQGDSNEKDHDDVGGTPGVAPSNVSVPKLTTLRKTATAAGLETATDPQIDTTGLLGLPLKNRKRQSRNSKKRSMSFMPTIYEIGDEQENDDQPLIPFESDVETSIQPVPVKRKATPTVSLASQAYNKPSDMFKITAMPTILEGDEEEEEELRGADGFNTNKQKKQKNDTHDQNQQAVSQSSYLNNMRPKVNNKRPSKRPMMAMPTIFEDEECETEFDQGHGNIEEELEAKNETFTNEGGYQSDTFSIKSSSRAARGRPSGSLSDFKTNRESISSKIFTMVKNKGQAQEAGAKAKIHGFDRNTMNMMNDPAKFMTGAVNLNKSTEPGMGLEIDSSNFMFHEQQTDGNFGRIQIGGSEIAHAANVNGRYGLDIDNTINANDNKDRGKGNVSEQPGSSDVESSMGSRFSGASGAVSVVFDDNAQKRFRCDLCGSSFTKKADAFRHIRGIHERDRKYRCHTCSSTFQEKWHLTTHIRSVHFKLRPFKCESCGKEFGTASDYRKHVRRVHEKIRPFKCEAEECNRTFFLLSELSRHLKTVHKYSEEEIAVFTLAAQNANPKIEDEEDRTNFAADSNDGLAQLPNLEPNEVLGQLKLQIQPSHLFAHRK